MASSTDPKRDVLPPGWGSVGGSHRGGPSISPEGHDALQALARRLEKLEQARLDVQEAVDFLRTLGATWVDIGKVAGISAQAAYQRWSEAGRAQNAARQRKLRQRP